MTKEKWEKPKLIVLLKGEPEENVLFNCKTASGINGPEGAYNSCNRPFKGYCKQCNKEAAS